MAKRTQSELPEGIVDPLAGDPSEGTQAPTQDASLPEGIVDPLAGQQEAEAPRTQLPEGIVDPLAEQQPEAPQPTQPAAEPTQPSAETTEGADPIDADPALSPNQKVQRKYMRDREPGESFEDFKQRTGVEMPSVAKERAKAGQGPQPEGESGTAIPVGDDPQQFMQQMRRRELQQGGYIPDEQGYLEGAAKGIVRGAGQVVQSAGSAFEMASPYLTQGLPIGPGMKEQMGEAGQQVGRAVSDVGESIREADALAPSPSVQQGGVFQPGNPRWWVERGSELVPQLLTQVGLGALTGGSSVAFMGTGGAMAAGQTYDEALESRIQSGQDRESAEQAAALEAATVGTITGILDRFGAGELLGNNPIVRKAIQKSVTQNMGRVGQKLAAMGGAGAVEGASEFVQPAVEHLAAAGYRGEALNLKQMLEQMKAEAALGGAAGAGVKAVTPDVGQQRGAQGAPDTPESQAQETPDGTQAPEQDDRPALQQQQAEVEQRPEQGVTQPTEQQPDTEQRTASEVLAPADQAALMGLGWSREDMQTMAPGTARTLIDTQARKQAQEEPPDERLETTEPQRGEVEPDTRPGDQPGARTGPQEGGETEARQADLRAYLQRARKAGARQRRIRAVEPETEAEQNVAERARRVGTRVEFVDAGEALPLSGMASQRRDNTLYIDRNAGHEKKLQALLTHEWTHDLRRSNPEAWDELRSELAAEAPRLLEYGAAEQQRAVDAERGSRAFDTDEEAVAVAAEDLTSEILSRDPKEVARTARQKPRLYERALSAMVRAARRLGFLRNADTIADRVQRIEDEAEVARGVQALQRAWRKAEARTPQEQETTDAVEVTGAEEGDAGRVPQQEDPQEDGGQQEDSLRVPPSRQAEEEGQVATAQPETEPAAEPEPEPEPATLDQIEPGASITYRMTGIREPITARVRSVEPEQGYAEVIDPSGRRLRVFENQIESVEPEAPTTQPDTGEGAREGDQLGLLGEQTRTGPQQRQETLGFPEGSEADREAAQIGRGEADVDADQMTMEAEAEPGTAAAPITEDTASAARTNMGYVLETGRANPETERAVMERLGAESMEGIGRMLRSADPDTLTDVATIIHRQQPDALPQGPARDAAEAIRARDRAAGEEDTTAPTRPSPPERPSVTAKVGTRRWAEQTLRHEAGRRPQLTRDYDIDAIADELDTPLAASPDALSNREKMQYRQAGIQLDEEAAEAWRERLGDRTYEQVLDEKMAGQAGRVRSLTAEALENPEAVPADVAIAALTREQWGTEPQKERSRESVDPGTLTTGQTFESFGVPFEVVERGDETWIRRTDGDRDMEVPVDELEALPVDQGTLSEGEAPPFARRRSEEANILRKFNIDVGEPVTASGRRKATKTTVREATGQRRREQPVTEKQALQASMRGQQRAARQAAKTTREQERERAKQQLDDLKQRIREKQDTVKAIRDEMARVVRERLPKSIRGEFITAVRDADTYTKLLRNVRRVEKRLAEHEHKQALDSLKKTLSKVNYKKLRPEFRDAIKKTVGGIDLRKMTQSTKRKLRGIRLYLAKAEDAQLPDYVMESLKRLDRAQPDELSTQELRDIDTAVQHFLHLNKLKNKLILGQKVRSTARASERIAEEAAERKKLVESEQPNKLSRQARRAVNPKSSKMYRKAERDLVREALAQGFTRFEQMMEEVSPTLRDIVYDRIGIDGRNAEERFEQDAEDIVFAELSEVGLKAGTKEFEEWRTNLRDNPIQAIEGELWLNPDEMAELYAHTLDPDNREEILNHGYVVERTDEEVSFTAEQLDGLTNELTAEERTLAEAVHRLYNTKFRDEVNQTWVEVHGYEKALRDRYYPRGRDLDRVTTSQDVSKIMSRFGEETLEGQGVFQERTGSQAPVKGRGALKTLRSHSQAVGRAVGYMAPLRDAQAVLNRAEVKQAIKNRWGSHMHEMISRLITQQAVGSKKFSKGDHIARQLLTNAGMGILAARISTLYIQPASLFIAAAHTKGRYVLKGLGGVADWKRIHGIAREYSPQWRSRYENFVNHMTSGVAGEPEPNYGPMPWRRKLMEHLTVGDRINSLVRWRAAEHQVRNEQPGLEPESDAYYEQVARTWERLTNRSESTSAPIEYSALLAYAKDTPVAGAFVMFQSSVSKIYATSRSGLIDLRRGVQQGDRQLAGRGLYKLGLVMAQSTYVTAARLAAPTALIAALMGSNDDDESGLLSKLGFGTLKELVGQIPLIGELLWLTVDTIENDRSLDYRGTPLVDVGNSAVKTVRETISGVESAIDKEVNAQGELEAVDHFWGAGESMLKTIGYLTGAPISITEYGEVGRKMLKDTETLPELRKTIRRLDQSKESETTNEKRRVWRAVQLNDREAFREAVKDMIRKGGRPGYTSLRNYIEGKYQPLERVIRNREKFEELPEHKQEQVRLFLEQGREMLHRYDLLYKQSVDLIRREMRERRGDRNGNG